MFPRGRGVSSPRATKQCPADAAATPRRALCSDRGETAADLSKRSPLSLSSWESGSRGRHDGDLVLEPGAEVTASCSPGQKMLDREDDDAPGGAGGAGGADVARTKSKRASSAGHGRWRLLYLSTAAPRAETRSTEYTGWYLAVSYLGRGGWEHGGACKSLEASSPGNHLSKAR
ncbi:uncharacterized protein UV8b_07489 [Ustilaginoidea virens]|uniref:Uncharacterized protein n=1 Tax=Ustilaginoidea virens TaxID=1159556 RepID=A0A8E5HXA0_USTVR|nr:uncharacterized protein UV8b_07489 [Ustilaginoidea virens]QUC23248.1 hypothetical protein UV8b_07489 [Ustilaginoidea virens]